MSYQKIQLVEIGMTDLMEAIRSIIQAEIANIKKSNPSTDETLLTRKEAAAKLGISLPTLAQRVKRGDLPAFLLGGKIMFKSSEVLSALKPIQTQKSKRQ